MAENPGSQELTPWPLRAAAFFIWGKMAGVQMGPNAVRDPQALMKALGSIQPAKNPTTPAERLNPDQQALEHIKAASVSLERAAERTNDEQILLVLNTIIGTLNKALLKFDGSQVLQSLQEAVHSFPPSVAPGMAAGGQPPQMPGQVPGLPSAPPGLPPQGIAPGGPLQI